MTRAAATASHEEVGFGLSELAARSGVPVPSIHHYRRLGLLPPAAQLAPNRFVYGERHVAALAAIRALRAHQVPLDTVRSVLPRLLEQSTGSSSDEPWESLLKVSGRLADPVLEPVLEAARLAFSRHGYDAVTVSEICEAAGIAKGTFYRYFDSKEAVFVAAARSTVEAVGDKLDRCGGTLTESEALGQLGRLLRPLAPLLLEAATRELREEPQVSGLVASVAVGLAARLGPKLRASSGRALPMARAVVETVILGLMRPALGRPAP